MHVPTKKATLFRYFYCLVLRSRLKTKSTVSEVGRGQRSQVLEVQGHVYNMYPMSVGHAVRTNKQPAAAHDSSLVRRDKQTNGQLNTVGQKKCIVGTHWFLFLTERVQREYFIFNTHWKWVLDKATHITKIFQFSFQDVLLFIHICTTGICGGILSYFTSKHNVVNP